MRRINPRDIPQKEAYRILTSTIAPRPIAFVSTLAPDGTANLAPYSFFNGFGSSPLTLVFSTVNRADAPHSKDTFHNIQHLPEVVINVVSHHILHQMAMASGDYPADVSEFTKTGLTPLPSELVQPPRVEQALVQFECKVRQIVPIGSGPGAGNLMICEAVLIHLAETIFDEAGKIDPQRIDLVGRMGRAWYVRAHGDAVFSVLRPGRIWAIGFDQLPSYVRQSPILTGNELAQLARCDAIPKLDDHIRTDPEVMNALAGNEQSKDQRLHLHAQSLIQAGNLNQAWQVLLIGMES